MLVYKILKRAAENGCSLSKGYVERMDEPTVWHADFVIRNVCFTHSFAKAFWGEKLMNINSMKYTKSIK